MEKGINVLFPDDHYGIFSSKYSFSVIYDEAPICFVKKSFFHVDSQREILINCFTTLVVFGILHKQSGGAYT
jgi:hypothetical protein